MRNRLAITFLFLLSLITSQSRASNNYFMPGDAFFHVTITEELLDKLSAQEPPYVWEYSLQWTFPGAFCGYAGYERATVEMADKQFLANLREVYRRSREYAAKEIRETRNGDRRVTEETNGLHLFFYRDDFDLQNGRLHLALRYNENWTTEGKVFGPFPRLCCFLNTAEAVEASWRDSREVPGLDATLPKVEIREGHAVTEPIHLPGNVKAIILPHTDLQAYYQREEYSDIFVIDSQGVTAYFAKDYKWKLSDGKDEDSQE